jgi:hypothetical protein
MISKKINIMLVDDDLMSHQVARHWVTEHATREHGLNLEWVPWDQVQDDNFTTIYNMIANQAIPSGIIFIDLNFPLAPGLPYFRQQLSGQEVDTAAIPDYHIGGVAFVVALSKNKLRHQNTLVVLATDTASSIDALNFARRLAPGLAIEKADNLKAGGTATEEVIQRAILRYLELFGGPVAQFLGQVTHESVEVLFSAPELRSRVTKVMAELLSISAQELGSIVDAFLDDGDPNGKGSYASEAIKSMGVARDQMSAVGGWLFALAAFQRSAVPYGNQSKMNWSAVFSAEDLRKCSRLQGCFLTPIRTNQTECREIITLYFDMCLELFRLGLRRATLSDGSLRFVLSNGIDGRTGELNSDVLRRTIDSYRSASIAEHPQVGHQMGRNVWRFVVASSVSFDTRDDEGFFGGLSFWKINIIPRPDEIEVIFSA